MNRKITFLITLLFLGYVSGVKAQSCPPNIDFELGNYSYWTYYSGLYPGAGSAMSWGSALSPSTFTSSNRFALTSGTGTDAYGFFPIVAPGGGNYSLQMGNTLTGQVSERATYTFTVPVTSGIWGVIYRYAVVLQNPGHAPAAQPKMDVTAYTTTGGATIPCTTYEYVSNATVPGFSLSPGTSVYTKPWTYGNMKFPGYGGQSVTLDFSVYDCSYGGHFGYCYIDMTCGFFANSVVGCATGSVVLSGPDGFDTYSWWDSSTFTTSYGSSQVVSITAPTAQTTYALIITPYSGYGCPDTLYTEVIPSTLHIGPGTLARADSDTTICSGQSAPLGSHATSSATPITYLWSPSSSLSCATCANPVATPAVTTVYTVVVTDNASCTATGFVTVNVVPTPTPISGPTSVCPLTTVNLTDGVAGGVWSCSPLTIGTITSTSGTIYGVSYGTFTVTYTTGGMCTVTRTESVSAAPAAISPNPAEVCVGQTLGMSDPTLSGTWSISPAGTFASINSSSGLVTGISAGTASVITYTAPSGCFAIDNLTVNPNPSPIAGVYTICQTQTALVTDGVPGGTWSLTPTTVATVTPGPGGGGGIMTGLTVGSGTVTYTLPTGCYTTANISVVPLPSPIVGSVNVCVGETGVVYTDATPFGTWSVSNSGPMYVDPVTGALSIYYAGTTSVVDTVYYTSGSTFCAASLVVTINPLPIISGITGVCVNGTTTLSSTTTVTWSSSDTTKAKVSSSGVITGISSGSVNITATNAAGCYTVTSVVVNALPPAIAGPTSLCVGTTINLTDPSTGGSFSTAPGLVASVTPTGTVRGLTAGSEVITYTVSSGCSTTDTILVDSTPTGIVGVLDVCPSGTTTLSDPVSGGTWSVSSSSLGSISRTGGTFTAGTTAGVDTVTYSLGAGCLTKSPVTINPLPAPILPTSPSVCVGGTTGLTDATLPGTWNASCPALTIGGGTGTVTGVAAGTCLVTYTASLTGCKTTKLVTVNPIPFGILPTSASVCAGDTIILTDATGGGSWSNTPTTFGSFAPLTNEFIGTNPGVTTVKYTVTGTGCSTTTPVTVNALPSLYTVTGGGTFCAGGSAVVGLSGSSSGVTYQLMVGGVPTGSAMTGGGGAISFGPQTMAGIYTVVARNTNTGCTRNMTGSATINVNPLPGPISGATAVCVSNTTTLTDPTGGGFWHSSNTLAATIGATTGIVTGITQGLSTTISYTLPTGCLTTTTVNVSPSPTAVTGASSVCVGACTTLTDTVTGGLWTSSSITTATVGSSTGQVCGVTGPGGAVIITYSLGTGCTRTFPMTVTPAPLPIGGNSSVCVGTCDTLTDLTPGGLWILNPTSAGLGTLTTTSTNKGSFCAGTTAGVANISYGASGGTGCSVNYNVTINPIPSPITGNNQVCQLSCTTLIDTTTGGIWSISNIHGSINASGATTANFCGISTVSSAPTPAIVKYTVAGCSYSFPVSINPLPSAISGASSVCQGATVTLNATPATGTWSSSSASLATVVPGPGASTVLTGGTSTGTVAISYTLPTSCATGISINVNRTPGLISGPSTVCVGNSVVLNNPTAGGVWSSSNTGVATVTAGAGPTTVTGVAAGACVISYTLGTCSVTYAFTVVAPPLPISIHSQVCVGGTWLYTDPSPGGTWSSSIPSVATISTSTAGGFLTGISSGTVIISYGTYGPSGCAVAATVVVNPIGPILPANPSVCQGQMIHLVDTTLGGTWTVSNSNASIDHTNGNVTGVLPGIDTVSYNLLTGCSASTVVTVNAAPGGILGSPAVCVGSTTSLSSSPIGGVWSSSVPTVGSVGSTSGVLTGNAPGLTTVTYSAITTGTTACPVSVVITVNSNPSVIVGASSLCTGTTTLMTNSTPGGTWSSSNPAIASISPTTGLVTAGSTSGLVTVSYILTGSSCYATKAVNVVAPPPAPTGTLSVCSGQVTTLTAPTGYTGTWSSLNTHVATIDAFGNVTGQAPGTAGITFAIGGGCSSAVTVTVNPQPAPILPYSGSLCVGSSLRFTDVTTGGTWSSSNPSIGSIDPISGIAVGVAAGPSVVITYQLTATGCMNTAVLTVVGGIGAITGQSSICLNATVPYSDTTMGGTWSSSLPGTASVDPLGNVTGVAAGTAIISYNTGGGCIPTQVVVVNPLPGVITGNLNVCQGDSTLLSNSVGVGTWSISNTSLATIGASTGEVVSVVTGSVTPVTDTVMYTLGPGCSATAIVSLNPLPASITGINDICQGSNTTLSSALGGGTWSSSNTSIGTVGSTSGVVTGTGIGNVNINYTNAYQCGTSYNVTVNGMPSPITGDFNVCVTGTVTLHDTLSTGTWISTNPTVATIGSSSGVVSGLVVGNSTIIYQNSVPGASNCAVAQAITVYPLPTVFNVTGGGSHCADDSGVHIGLSGSESGVNYFIYLSGSSTAVGHVPGTGAPLDLGLYTVAGTYTVTATSTSTGCGLPMNGSANVHIIPSVYPSVAVNAAPGATVCAGSSVTFTSVPVSGGATPSYIWSINSNPVAITPTYTYIPANHDTVEVAMTSSANCAVPLTVTRSVVVTVNPFENPTVALSLTPGDTVCAGSPVVVRAESEYGGTAPAFTWFWNTVPQTGSTGSTFTLAPHNGDVLYATMASNYPCRLANIDSSNKVTLYTEEAIYPNVEITANPGTSISPGDTVTFTAVVTNAVPSPSYQWYVNGVPVLNATSRTYTRDTFSTTKEDSISVAVTSSGICTITGHQWVYMRVHPEGVPTITSSTGDISVVPNPNKGVFTVKGSLSTSVDEDVSLEITDVLGQVIYKNTVNAKSGKLNQQIKLAGNVANGMYILSLHSESDNLVFHLVVEQ